MTGCKEDKSMEKINGKIGELVARLRYYNEWRRGADTEMPEPKQIGEDIDEACDALEEMFAIIEQTLDENSISPADAK